MIRALRALFERPPLRRDDMVVCEDVSDLGGLLKADTIYTVDDCARDDCCDGVWIVRIAGRRVWLQARRFRKVGRV